MTWFVLAAVAALCYALQGAWTKRLTSMVSREAATWAIFALAFPLLAVYLAVDGLPDPTARFWVVVAVNTVLYVVSFRLYVSALEVGELGITYPLLAVTPVFVVPVEWAVLGDRVGAPGLAGIVMVATGVYLLHVEGEGAEEDRRGAGAPAAGLRTRFRRLLAPFRGLAARPGARRMLGVALIWSVSGTLDRAAVLSASPAAYGVAVSLAVGLALAPAALRDLAPRLLPGRRDGSGEVGGTDRAGGGGPQAAGAAPGAPEADPDVPSSDRAEEPAGAGPDVDGSWGDGGGGDGAARDREAWGRRPARSRWAVLGGLGLQGLLFAAMFVAQMEALRLSLAANVITVKRSGTLLTVLLGGVLFREKGLAHRLAGTVVVLVGVYLVASS